jgi:cytochrome c-type biogenesis protein CcmH/NrfF
VTRRDFLARSALGAVALALIGRRVRGQSRPAPPTGDPLNDPTVVQERAEATAADNDVAVKGIEHRLKCTCGCNLDVYTCRTTDFTCSYSPALHQEVLALRQEGKNPEEVVAGFVAKYGEQILMAPKPEGFNLAGYLVPGALVAAVGTALTVVLVRRSRRMATLAPSAPASAPEAVDDERLRQALADVQD